MIKPTEVDVALRQAVFYEYVKENEADKEKKRTDELLLLLLALILGSGIDFTKTVSRTQITVLLAKVKKKLGDKIAIHDKELTSALQNVMKYVLDVTKKNYAFLTGKQTVQSILNGTAGKNKELWLRLTKGYVPGVGIEPKNLIADAGKSILSQSARLIKQAYVEKWSADEIIKRVKGTAKLGFKDGLINKIGNQAKTAVRTLGSHINSALSHFIGSFFYDTYQWISTIDSVTTNICRLRHMKIYFYGQGPVPPAHPNCRSIIVGMAGSLVNQVGATYYNWLRSQPEDVNADMLTPAEARAFREGRANSRDYTAFRNNRRMTPEEFGKRLPTMQRGMENGT